MNKAVELLVGRLLAMFEERIQDMCGKGENLRRLREEQVALREKLEDLCWAEGNGDGDSLAS